MSCDARRIVTPIINNIMKKVSFILVSLLVISLIGIASFVVDSVVIAHFGIIAFLIAHNIVLCIILAVIVFLLFKYRVFFISRKLYKTKYRSLR
jgi:hypothetical protein